MRERQTERERHRERDKKRSPLSITEQYIYLTSTQQCIQCPLSPGTDILSQDLWEVKLTPGKGRGVFARRTIQRGTHLLTETALFAVAPPALVPGRGFELAAMAAEVERRYLLLPPASRQEYLSCHEERFPGDGDTQDQVEGHHLMAIFRSNAYTRRDGLVGIYPKVALINHSCQPNVLNTDVEDGRRVIVATRDIQKGEEVNNPFIRPPLPPPPPFFYFIITSSSPLIILFYYNFNPIIIINKGVY